MANEIIPYLEMCRREGASLQRGMNFNLGGNHSVILMSLRRNAPYQDRLEDNGETLIYEGHDVPRSKAAPTPKLVAQSETTPACTLSENGKFHQAAKAYGHKQRPSERVRVYEKVQQGIWSYNGMFVLVDSWQEADEHRSVFRRVILMSGNDLMMDRQKVILACFRISWTNIGAIFFRGALDRK